MLMKQGLSRQRGRKLNMEEVPEINSNVVKIMPPQTLEDLPQHFGKQIVLSQTTRSTGLMWKAEEESNEGKEEAEVQRPCSTAESRSLRKRRLELNFVHSLPELHDSFSVSWYICGNVPQEICDELTEICYFPDGRENPECFPEQVAMVKQCGVVKLHCLFDMLAKVYSAVFIGAKNISDSKHSLRLTLQGAGHKYHFIWNTEGGKSEETLRFLNMLKINSSQLLVKKNSQNITEFVSKHQLMRSLEDSGQKPVDVANVSQEPKIQIDEDMEICSSRTLLAKEIVEEMKDTASYKKEMLKHNWRKRLCRKKSPVDTPTEDEKSPLREKVTSICTRQNQCNLTVGITKFINGIQHLHHYFLKWMQGKLYRVKRQADATAKEKSQFREQSMRLYMQIQCDFTNGITKLIHGIQHLNRYFVKLTKHFFLKGEHYFWKCMKSILHYIARVNLLRLQGGYKEKCHTAGNDPQQLVQLDESTSTCKLEQFYEKKHATVKENKAKNQRHLSEVATALMLEGFSVELIDTDTAISLQLITNALTTLNEKQRGQSKMMVITLPGIQSTDRSTLLNAAFGLQFVASSGRCAFGTFTTLLRVPEKLQQEIGCDFILMMDTKGSEAPELTKLEDSCEHNSELAALMTRLSDITIMNLAMENAIEIKDILQIVRVFWRMKAIGHKPNCQFVRPNVCDMPVYEQNMRDGKCLLEQHVKVNPDFHPDKIQQEKKELPTSVQTPDLDVSRPDPSELEQVTSLDEQDKPDFHPENTQKEEEEEEPTSVWTPNLDVSSPDPSELEQVTSLDEQDKPDFHPEKTQPEEEEQPTLALTPDLDISPRDPSELEQITSLDEQDKSDFNTEKTQPEELEQVTRLEELWSTANLVLPSKAEGPALGPPSPPTSPEARRRQRARMEICLRRQSSRLAACSFPPNAFTLEGQEEKEPKEKKEEEKRLASSGASRKIRLLCKPRAEYLFCTSGFKTPFY